MQKKGTCPCTYIHVHINPFKAIKDSVEFHKLLNPDSLYTFFGFPEFIPIPPTMTSPWQPSGCKARVSTAWGAATKASGPKLKTWAKSAEIRLFDSLSEHVWANSSFVRFNGKTTRKPTFLDITSTVSTQPSNLWTIYIDNMGSMIWAIAI